MLPLLCPIASQLNYWSCYRKKNISIRAISLSLSLIRVIMVLYTSCFFFLLLVILAALFSFILLFLSFLSVSYPFKIWLIMALHSFLSIVAFINTCSFTIPLCLRGTCSFIYLLKLVKLFLVPSMSHFQAFFFLCVSQRF